MTPLTSRYQPPAVGVRLSAMLAETRLRLLNASRYPGQLLLEILIPIVLAAMPLLLGRATAGADAAANFELNTGTTNYVAFMLIGTNTFAIVSGAFWHIAHWMRFEQETGTLEAIYLTPTNSATLAGGVALYSALRTVATALIAYLIGSAIFGVNPFQGNVLLAILFILVGLIPLYGAMLLFGALVLRVKESNALLNLMQWLVAFFMGIFFPVAVLPPLVRLIAFLFPPTWMVNGTRAALLGVGYFFGEWYLDMAILWSFMLLAPLFGFWVFQRTENGLRRNQGIGQF